MLLVGGQPVSTAALLQHPAIQAAAARFLAAAGSSSMPAGKQLIYACQGEEATCAADEDALLCSSDATTCLIAAVAAPVPSNTHAAAAAAAGAAAGQPPVSVARIVHHDEATTRSLPALQQTVAGLGSAVARLWLVGAYADARGTGAEVRESCGLLVCRLNNATRCCRAPSHPAEAHRCPSCFPVSSSPRWRAACLRSWSSAKWRSKCSSAASAP